MHGIYTHILCHIGEIFKLGA
ncbi:hypothetical protein MNBD_GAMMA15-890, partial [hydrothermal vent metagenome]